MRRAWLILTLFVGCGHPAASQDGAPPREGGSEECFGALPPRHCDTKCSCCVGCSVAAELCVSSAFFPFGNGECLAQPGGALAVDIDAAAFASTEAGSIVDNQTLEIVARTTDDTIAISMPMMLGTYDCATPSLVASIGHYQLGAMRAANNNANASRPPCTLTLTKVGGVGDTIDGAFSATLSGSVTETLTNGTFSVMRSEYTPPN